MASQPPNNIVQTPQVPPINMPEALDTKLQTVDLPAFYEDAALDTLEKGVRNGMDIVEKLHKIVAPDPAAIREDFKAWHEQLASLKAENFHYKVIIGVVGSTGAGKSSVINALLDEERLVPTNCMRACTAVVTEISYNYETEDLYRAAIEFIGLNDWISELETLFGDLREGGEIFNKDSENGVALAKIQAVYPGITMDNISEMTPEALLQRFPAVQQLLGTTKEIFEADSLRFHKKLQKYVDSSEKTSTKSAKEMEYWPLIKVVRLYVKSEVLATGAVVVDLPGSHDANAARAGVAEGYIKNCAALWIVAPITRAVDDRTAHTLLGQTFRKQLLMDGGFANVSFICSKSDDISITEATLSLNLEDDLEAANAELERLEEEIQRLGNTRGELAEHLKVYSGVVDDIAEQLLVWDQLMDKAEEGEEVFEPMPAPQSNLKKRKRIIFTGIGEVISINSEACNNDSSSCSQSLISPLPLTEKAIKSKIAELTIKKRQARQQLTELKSQILDALEQVTTINAQHLRLRNEMATYCIQARNEYSTIRIKQDFVAGLQELDMQAAEKKNPLSFDPTAPLRDYNSLAKQLAVFCVSSRGYQKLSGRLKGDGDPPVFSNGEETDIPRLQSHCIKLTEKARELGARKFLNNLSLIINSLLLWTVQSSKSSVFSMRIDDEKFGLLEQILNYAVSDTMKDLNGVMEENLYARLSSGIDSAAKQTVLVSTSWAKPLSDGGIHWSTYSAVCRRYGSFGSRARGLVDFNGELSNPLIEAIAVEWERTFTSLIPPVIQKYSQRFVTAIEKFHSQIQDRGSQGGKELLPLELDILGKQLAMYEQQAMMIVDDTIQQIASMQRDINREFTPIIKAFMAPAYDLCVGERGVGAYFRMKSHIMDHITTYHQVMFQSCTTKIQQSLQKLVRTTASKLGKSTDTILLTIKRDYKLIENNLTQQSRQAELLEKKAMRVELGKVQNDCREMMGLERLGELELECSDVLQEMKEEKVN